MKYEIEILDTSNIKSIKDRIRTYTEIYYQDPFLENVILVMANHKTLVKLSAIKGIKITKAKSAYQNKLI